jgi:hypothetical protein
MISDIEDQIELETEGEEAEAPAANRGEERKDLHVVF